MPAAYFFGRIGAASLFWAGLHEGQFLVVPEPNVRDESKRYENRTYRL